MKKRYQVYVQFDSQTIIVVANNQREAREKARQKLLKKPAWQIADKTTAALFIDEC